MNPYRLVALAIIALFALGYARLLIDTGVKDEHPRSVPVDFLTKAACTAVAEPLAEALGISWEPMMETSSDQSMCVLAASIPREATAEDVLTAVDAVFRLLRWERLESASGMDREYARDPVACRVQVGSEIRAVCAR